MFVCSECGSDGVSIYIEKRFPDTQMIIRKYLCSDCYELLVKDIKNIADLIRKVKP